VGGRFGGYSNYVYVKRGSGKTSERIIARMTQHEARSQKGGRKLMKIKTWGGISDTEFCGYSPTGRREEEISVG